jgi:Reverse transcriptase (RNA-dependent DNA polymerase)
MCEKQIDIQIKRNGIFRARLVACGYSQIPGIDCFAPVINDVTLRILLIIMLVWNLKGKVVDIETAFLHGELKEKIHMH